MITALPLEPEPAQEAPGGGAEGGIPCEPGRGYLIRKPGRGTAGVSRASPGCLCGSGTRGKDKPFYPSPWGFPMLPHF